MSTSIFLITPPFTQLNTPYPATAYLKGFLNTKNIPSSQADLGIETILCLFSKNGLTELFKHIEYTQPALTDNTKRIVILNRDYINTIDDVILFLQGKNPTLAYHICQKNFLPEASRFENKDQMEWAFGSMGIQDKAKYLCTMYLEDLSDLIKETVDEHFGFSRYAEKLGRSANSFDQLHEVLQLPNTYIDSIYLTLLKEHIERNQPLLVALSVPFPGNLYTALRCGQWIKKNHPHIHVAMGGGFANTELRSLSDTRVFDYVDYITLDDGEAPVELLIGFLNGKVQQHQLKRAFLKEENTVKFINDISSKEYKQSEVGTPDYNGLPLDNYISAIEVVNPMHRLWSDGRWNKLTMAHGCYWGKCTFCDISLDYIKLYEPSTASMICDRIEQLIAQTGNTGFHFVDEAAPPSLMKALALEIIKRKLIISWWTNIRFEKSFSFDLCQLLKASGCIAVSGGLEVASDRLLELIQKGITVSQVAQVNRNFSEAGIMVHAYLMYGFPTQTAQETIDSLEMVRQLFKTGVLQSAFWHQFTMTAHSPVGLNPEKFNVSKEKDEIGTFANNDIMHVDPTGTDHDTFSFGLKKSLFNYMQHHAIDDPLQNWFDFKVPKTSVEADYIEKALTQDIDLTFKPNAKVIWLGNAPSVEYYIQSKKGMQREMAKLNFITKSGQLEIQILKSHAEWLIPILVKISFQENKTYTLQEIKNDYESAGLEDFELFWDNKPMTGLNKLGLLKI